MYRGYLVHISLIYLANNSVLSVCASVRANIYIHIYLCTHAALCLVSFICDSHLVYRENVEPKFRTTALLARTVFYMVGGYIYCIVSTCHLYSVAVNETFNYIASISYELIVYNFSNAILHFYFDNNVCIH